MRAMAKKKKTRRSPSLAKQLMDEATRKRLEERYREIMDSPEMQRQLEALEKSQRITAEDLAIVINAK
jgi:hypothetical protein